VSDDITAGDVYAAASIASSPSWLAVRAPDRAGRFPRRRLPNAAPPPQQPDPGLPRPARLGVPRAHWPARTSRDDRAIWIPAKRVVA